MSYGLWEYEKLIRFLSWFGKTKQNGRSLRAVILFTFADRNPF